MRLSAELCNLLHFVSRPLISVLAITPLWSFSAAQAPAPISVPVANDFLGYDGQWSPVSVRLGSNSQYLSLLPHTASPETWVIGPGGCDGTFTCQQERGGLFFTDQSTTWTNLGLYQLNVDSDLGDTGYADYGLDTIALTDAVSVGAQIVGVINTTEFWLGQFGLGVAQTRFNGALNRLTFLSSLVENVSLIPSHSYGYTAGAFYRLKNVPASLTLGGVDTNRFQPNAATFDLGPQLQPIVALNQITVQADPFQSSNKPHWSSDPLVLLDESNADLYTIDSSTPFLWLPKEVCDQFANALGLTYNETLELYLFADGSSPEILTDWNMVFTFSFSDLPGSSTNVVDLTLPYGAFNLQLTYPFPNLDANFTSPPTNYFPLRRATSNNQYVIGRAFLQESYLTVDYERNNFSISQAKFALDSLTNTNLVPIARPVDSNWTGPAEPPSPGIATGAKAGAAVAAVATVAVIGSLCYYIFILKRRRRPAGGEASKETTEASEPVNNVNELHGEARANEMPASRRFPLEADSSAARYELPGTLPVEMSAGELPTTFYSAGNGARQRPSVEKTVEHDHEQRAHSPIPPPYSPSSDGISPSSAHPNNGTFRSGTNSSNREISPLETSARGLSRMTSQRTAISPTSISPFSTIIPPIRARLVGSSMPEHRSERGYREDDTGVELEEQLPPLMTPERTARFSWE